MSYIYFNKEIGVQEVLVKTKLGHHEKYLETTEMLKW
jgi:hypothetical protein